MQCYLSARRVKFCTTHCGSEMQRDDLMTDDILSTLQSRRYGDVCGTAVH